MALLFDLVSDDESQSAQGETDVPDQIAEFISQRRRWVCPPSSLLQAVTDACDSQLNGSFFAGTYSLTHTLQLMHTEHSFGKKVALVVQAIYNLSE